MGLDQYLRKTSREEFERLSEVNRMIEECNDRLDRLFDEKYKDLFQKFVNTDYDDIDEDALTPEQKTALAGLRAEWKAAAAKTAAETGMELDEYGDVKASGYNAGTEIGYWRGCWPLHRFIVENFWKGKDNNMADIPLTAESIGKIVEWAESRPDDVYRGYTIETFKAALKYVEGGEAVYYHPWY